METKRRRRTHRVGARNKRRTHRVGASPNLQEPQNATTRQETTGESTLLVSCNWQKVGMGRIIVCGSFLNAGKKGGRMPSSSMMIGTKHKVEVELDVQRVYGRYLVSPSLVMPVTLRTSYVDEKVKGSDGKDRWYTYGISVTSIGGTLTVASGGYGCSASINNQPLSLVSRSAEASQSVNLIVPLDALKQRRFELLRKGLDLSCTLNLELFGFSYCPAETILPFVKLGLPEVGMSEPLIGIGQIDIVIPASQWARDILPELGFGQVYVQEIILDKVNSGKWRKATGYLTEAWEAHGLHDDEKVMDKCYKVWEAVGNNLLGAAKKNEQNITRELSKYVGGDIEKASKLAKLLLSMKDYAHLSSHDMPQPIVLTYWDTELILLMTQVALSYICRLRPSG